MQSPSEILAGLAHIANHATFIAVVWHLALLAASAALLRGWRPSLRTAGVLLALPAGSVAGVAFAFRNPFNGVVFAGLTVALLGLALRLGPARASAGPAWARALGWPLCAFGWLYPHFLEEGHTWLAYLYAAPTGLLPCPTLSLLIGLALLGGGLGARAFSLTLAVAGLFYGLFGALRLGVAIDLALVVGAAGLFGLALHRRTALALAGAG